MQKSVVLLAILLIIVSISGIPAIPASAQSGTQTSATSISINQVLNITASPKFSLFSLNAIADISASVNLSFSGSSNGSLTSAVLAFPMQVEVVSSFSPSQITAAALVNNSLEALPVQQLPAQATALRTYSVMIPSGTESSTISIHGSQTGEYLLGRYVSDIPYIIALAPSNLTTSVSSQTNLFLPRGSIIAQAYGFGSAAQSGAVEPVPPATTSGAPPGQVRYELPSSIATLVMQSTLFVPLSIVLTVLAILLIAFASLGFFARGRVIIGNLFERALLIVNWVAARFTKLSRLRPKRIPFGWKSFLRSKNFLVLFLICSVLMISFAALTGPNPTINVYAIAPNQESAQIQGAIQSATPSKLQMVTPSQDYTDFNVMSSVGMFKVLVVSDYPSQSLTEVSKFILPSINNVPLVIITPSADPSFVAKVRAEYSGPIINLSDTSDISSALSLSVTSNALGLRISSSNFKLVLIIEATLSFLLVLFGWAYLGAKAAEPSDEKSLLSVSSLIVSGVFVFYFSEVLYVATSATLNFPLSLHAVISGAETITAVGLLGQAIHVPFGGGSTPRLAMGVLGIIIGGFGAAQGKMFSKGAVALIIGVSVILVVNPLQVGRVVFQGLLLFVGNSSLGAAFTSSLTIKGFLYGIGSALGGTITPTYLMSAGKILYFAGLVPLAFVRKMSRGTSTLAFLLCAIIVGDGGVRVGEMTPDKTVIAILPGIIAGVIIALILLFISWVEKYLTTAYVRSRP